MVKNKKLSGIMSKMGTLLALIILCVVLAIATPNFLGITNIMNILKQTAVNALISAGMLVALITAGIDLSVGANAITCSCVMGAMLQAGVTNPFILIVVGLLVGTFIGLCNGLLLTKLHLPHPFVSTLGMKNILCGVALLVVNSKMISNFPKGVTWLGDYSMLNVGAFPGIPVSFIAVILIFIVFHFFLNRTALGRSIYCVGGNPEAARLSGINSDNVLTFCYALSGFMCSLAAIVLIGRAGIANPANAIQPYDTDAIAACIIGGASFMGGKGTIWGTLIGALIISVIRNGLTLLNAQSDIQYIVIGAVIILSVLLDVTRERMAAKARRMAASK
jgi:ribose transport system permease protein